MTTKNDDARADRLKAALRENLKRRKVQVRGRGEASAESGTLAENPVQPDERTKPGSDAPSS